MTWLFGLRKNIHLAGAELHMHLAERETSMLGGMSPSTAHMVHGPSKAPFFTEHLVEMNDMVLGVR